MQKNFYFLFLKLLSLFIKRKAFANWDESNICPWVRIQLMHKLPMNRGSIYECRIKIRKQNCKKCISYNLYLVNDIKKVFHKNYSLRSKCWTICYYSIYIFIYCIKCQAMQLALGPKSIRL